MSNERVAAGQMAELRSALEVLVQTHTNDDSLVGFTIKTRGSDQTEQYSIREYLDAWTVVRRALGYQTAQDARPEG